MSVIKNLFTEEKTVKMNELFYDVVFVYAISKIAHTILHLHHGVVSLNYFLEFLLLTLIFAGMWTYQTFYTNRFGFVTGKDVTFMLINMFILIYLSNTISTGSQYNSLFIICSGLLFLSIALQYLLNMKDGLVKEEKHVSLVFIYTTLFCAVMSFVSLLLPESIYYQFFLIVILIGLTGPMLGLKVLIKSPVNMGHLVERFSLFVIIMFGETIIGLASVFSIKHFEVTTIFQFLIIAFLFLCYWTKIDYFMDHHQKTAGFVIFYAHCLIFLAIGLINAAIVLGADPKINGGFSRILMFGALILFFVGLHLNMVYFKTVHQNIRLALYSILVLVIGFVISLFLPATAFFITLNAAMMLIIIYILFIRQKNITEAN